MAPRRTKKAKVAVVEEDVPEDHEQEAVDDAQQDVEVWKPYHCQSIDFGVAHPGNIMEGMSLSGVSLPPATYPIRDSLGYQIDQGLLSSAQIEGVLYACQMHTKFLPSGERHGFFLGDSAGVGKGRQVAGIIMDNLFRGRSRHAWFSVSKDLCEDAQRDFEDLQCNVTITKSDEKLDAKRAGVAFCTYTKLVGKGNLNEMVRWLCDGYITTEFDGCLIFDESHKAKESGTKTGAKVAELQAMLPKARVVYSSATGISGVESMGYMTRMGLFGEKLAFSDFERFKSCFSGRMGNFGTLEMIALNFKAKGSMVARTVGYQGVEFETVFSTLDQATASMFRDATTWFNDLKKDMNDALCLASTTPKNEARRPKERKVEDAMERTYWNTHLRFMRQLITSTKVPKLVEVARQAISDGHCVVIGLQTTSESCLDVYRKTNGDDYQYPDLLSGCKATATQFVMSNFPVKHTWFLDDSDPVSLGLFVNPRQLVHELALISHSVVGLESKMFIRKVFDFTYEPSRECPAYREGGFVIECERKRARILRRLDDIQLPPSALDLFVDQLGGPSQVAEMTGRHHRQTRLANGKVVISARCKEKEKEAHSVNIQEKNAFQSGKKLVAIVSDAASTGISLHADRKARNQRRRVHCTLELPWQASQAIQQLGRSHRTNQVCAPVFKLISSGLGGEHRFLASISKRLQTLGALTQGNRKASIGSLSFGECQYESKYGERALSTLVECTLTRVWPSSVNLEELIALCQEHIEMDAGFAENGTWCAPLIPGTRIQTAQDVFSVVQEAMCLVGDQTLSPIHNPPDAVARQQLMAADNGEIRRHENEFLRPVGLTVHVKVSKFFNRILGLPLTQQAVLFNLFCLLLDAEIREAKREGTYDRGVQQLRSASVERLFPESLVYKSPMDNGELWVHELITDRGMTFFGALEELEFRVRARDNPETKREDVRHLTEIPSQAEFAALIAGSGGSQFFRSKETIMGSTRVCLGIKIPYRRVYLVCRPRTGKSSMTEMPEEDMHRIYTIVPRVRDAEEYWREEYTSPDCSHGRNCYMGDRCLSGRREATAMILSGDVMSHWNRLDGIQLTHSRRPLSIVQANITSTQERVVGVLVDFNRDALDTYIDVIKHRDLVALRGVRVAFDMPTEMPLTKSHQEEYLGFNWDIDNVVVFSTHPKVEVGFTIIMFNKATFKWAIPSSFFDSGAEKLTLTFLRPLKGDEVPVSREEPPTPVNEVLRCKLTEDVEEVPIEKKRREEV